MHYVSLGIMIVVSGITNNNTRIKRKVRVGYGNGPHIVRNRSVVFSSLDIILLFIYKLLDD